MLGQVDIVIARARERLVNKANQEEAIEDAALGARELSLVLDSGA